MHHPLPKPPPPLLPKNQLDPAVCTSGHTVVAVTTVSQVSGELEHVPTHMLNQKSLTEKKKAPHSVESLANFLQPVTILNVSFYLFLNLAILHCTCTTR